MNVMKYIEYHRIKESVHGYEQEYLQNGWPYVPYP